MYFFYSHANLFRYSKGLTCFRKLTTHMSRFPIHPDSSFRFSSLVGIVSRPILPTSVLVSYGVVQSSHYSLIDSKAGSFSLESCFSEGVTTGMSLFSDRRTMKLSTFFLLTAAAFCASVAVAGKPVGSAYNQRRII